MKNYKIVLVGLFATLLLSCSNNEYNYYSGEKRIQFGPPIGFIYRPSDHLLDTTKLMTFYYEPSNILVDTVYFDVYAIGGVSNIDRSILIKQEVVKDTTNAIAGEDYVAFDDPSVKNLYTIKAGAANCQIPILLKRDIKLKTKTLVLKIVLAENEYFKLGEKPYLWRKIYFTDRLSRPNSWDNIITSILGTYSLVKHRFMIDETGERWDDAFILKCKSDVARLLFFKNVVKTELTNYNNSNPTSPLTDENGNLVVFP